MTRTRLFWVTLLAMLAFAANSILCRIALERTAIDPAIFTAIRLVSGAVMLLIVVALRDGARRLEGSWLSAFALFIYAAGFSFAYVSLPTATGALLLFGTVQVTMMGYALWAGERLRPSQLVGYLIALGGLVGLLMPGLAAPSFEGAALMMGAGIAWAVYSLRASAQGDATRETTGNFVRTIPFALVLLMFGGKSVTLDMAGVAYAIASGAITSGLGYVLWYAALRGLRTTTAATVQLSGPLIVALGGIVLLAEALTLRWLLAALAILGGIAWVILQNGAGPRPTVAIPRAPAGPSA